MQYLYIFLFLIINILQKNKAETPKASPKNCTIFVFLCKNGFSRSHEFETFFLQIDEICGFLYVFQKNFIRLCVIGKFYVSLQIILKNIEYEIYRIL